MDTVKQLLLNMLFIIAPVMMYSIFWMDRAGPLQSIVNRRIIMLLCTAVALGCMTIRLELYPGFVYDLREIPLALCFLYAGFRPALIVAAAITAYRWYIDGDLIGCFMTMTITFLSMLVLWYAKPLIVGHSRSRNIYSAAGAGLLIGGICAAGAFVAHLWTSGVSPALLWSYFGLYSIIHGFTMGSAVYVIEQLKANLSLRRQAQHHDNVRMLSEMAASFANDIQNPVTTARGFVQILRQTGIKPEKKRIYLQLVEDEIDKVQSIISNYLAFAKPHIESIELADAGQLIRQAVESVEAYASLSWVVLETQVDDKLLISANKEKFIQCIVQLCKHGIQSMPGGGKLQIVGFLHDGQVGINIIDNGTGMTEEDIQRLGTPFYSAKEKGAGLEMMVAYRIIRSLRGKIDVTSQVGKGTCFSVLIPSVSPASYH